MTEKLTMREFGILQESLKAWIDKETAGGMMFDLMTTMMTPKSENEKIATNLKAQREKLKREREFRKNQRKEEAVLLQAKLIKIRDELLGEKEKKVLDNT